VRILAENVQDGRLGQFKKLPSYVVGSYDYDSVMHYRSTAFTKNGKPTILKIDGGTIPGGKVGLSKGDIADVAKMYDNAPP
jgi:astacin